MRVSSKVGHYSSFVIKIWVEDGRMVRGLIQHVGTRESIYFSDFDKMLQFIMIHRGTSTKGMTERVEKKSGDDVGQIRLDFKGK